MFSVCWGKMCISCGLLYFISVLQLVLHTLLTGTSSCDEKQMQPRDGPTFTIFGRSHLYLYILPVKEKMSSCQNFFIQFKTCYIASSVKIGLQKVFASHGCPCVSQNVNVQPQNSLQFNELVHKNISQILSSLVILPTTYCSSK